MKLEIMDHMKNTAHSKVRQKMVSRNSYIKTNSIGQSPS
jgi:hypothetical protein